MINCISIGTADIPTLKRSKEGVLPITYLIKQLRIDGKAIESRPIV